MVKRWKEIDEVIKPTIEIPKELYKYDDIMKEYQTLIKRMEQRKCMKEKNT